MRDGILRLAEQVVQATEVVEHPAEVDLIAVLFVQLLRALRQRPRTQPVAAALGDDRRLERHVRDGERVAETLGELERELDVLACGLEVPLAPRASGAPLENVRPQAVARETRARRQLVRL